MIEPGATRHDPPAPHRRAGRGRRSIDAISTRCSKSASPKPTRSTRRSRAVRWTRKPHDPAPRVRRAALDEAVLQLHHPRLAQGRSRDAAAAAASAARPQRRLDAPLQRRRALDARHLGVPVVRRVGSRVSRDRVRADRSGFRQTPTRALTRERYMHPNGQLPAYEWAFDDVNPPVHAWAACGCTRSKPSAAAAPAT